MSWRVEFSLKAEKQIKKLDAQTRQSIYSWLDDNVEGCENPRLHGRALTGRKDGGYWRYRVGDYRIVCDIQYDKLVVLAIRIEPRDKVYAHRRHK